MILLIVGSGHFSLRLLVYVVCLNPSSELAPLSLIYFYHLTVFYNVLSIKSQKPKDLFNRICPTTFRYFSYIAIRPTKLTLSETEQPWGNTHQPCQHSTENSASPLILSNAGLIPPSPNPHPINARCKLAVVDCKFAIMKCKLTIVDCKFAIGKCKSTIDDYKSAIERCEFTIVKCKLTIDECKFAIVRCRFTILDLKYQFTDLKSQITDSKFKITDLKFQIPNLKF